MYRKVMFVLICLAFLTACAGAPVLPSPSPSPTEAGDEPVSSEDPTPTGISLPPGPSASPLEPIPGEEKLTRGEVFVESSQILVLESFPPQFTVSVEGNLPTPCHKLRAQISQPDEQNQIHIDLYSLVDPEEICIQVLKPFTANLPLGSFPDGSYSIWLNGEKIGEFTSP